MNNGNKFTAEELESIWKEMLAQDNRKPKRLDRFEWEKCEYCGEPSPHRDCVIDGNVEQFLCSRDGLFGDAYINTREINYCPFCGKPLTEEAWKMLEMRLDGATHGD